MRRNSYSSSNDYSYNHKIHQSNTNHCYSNSTYNDSNSRHEEIKLTPSFPAQTEQNQNLGKEGETMMHKKNSLFWDVDAVEVQMYSGSGSQNAHNSSNSRFTNFEFESPAKISDTGASLGNQIGTGTGTGGESGDSQSQMSQSQLTFMDSESDSENRNSLEIIPAPPPPPKFKSQGLGKSSHSKTKAENKENNSKEFICSQCRSLKIETHLVTLKKLRNKALRYTSQLDEIRGATKKRETELNEVMARLVNEERKLHDQLENVDKLSYKMNVRRNQFRQEQMELHHQENAMAEKLQSLKEKEIFVNCQMLKIQSEEVAIEHRKRELQKEKLRIEKLAQLIFKTDLSTITYHEFHRHIWQMQLQLEKRYRKMKVLEHYCQHHSLPLGMKLEPLTPLNDDHHHNLMGPPLDPAVAAFEEALWGNKFESAATSSAMALLPFKSDTSSRILQSFPNENNQYSEVDRNNKNSLLRMRPATSQVQGLDACLNYNCSKKNEQSSALFSPSYRSKSRTNTRCTKSNISNTRADHDIGIGTYKNCAQTHSPNNDIDSQSNNYIPGGKSSIATTLYQTDSNTTRDNSKPPNPIDSLQSLYVNKNNKCSSRTSQQPIQGEQREERERTKQFENKGTAKKQQQKFAMSAKQVCADAHRLLQTPLTKPSPHGKHTNTPIKGKGAGAGRVFKNMNMSAKICGQNSNWLARRNLSHEDTILEECTEDDDHENENEAPAPGTRNSVAQYLQSACDSFLSDIDDDVVEVNDINANAKHSNTNTENLDIFEQYSSTNYSEAENENEILDETATAPAPKQQREGSNTNDLTSRQNDKIKNTAQDNQQDVEKKHVCSIFRNSRNSEKNVSSKSLFTPEENVGKIAVPFKVHWSNNSDESMDPENDVDLDNKIDNGNEPENDNSYYSESYMPRPTENENENENHPDDGQNSKSNHESNSSYTRSEREIQILKPCNNTSKGAKVNQFQNIAIHNRLSKLSDRTKSQIVYAIGEKALAQVAKAMDRVSDWMDYAPSPSEQNKHHGDHAHTQRQQQQQQQQQQRRHAIYDHQNQLLNTMLYIRKSQQHQQGSSGSRIMRIPKMAGENEGAGAGAGGAGLGLGLGQPGQPGRQFEYFNARGRSYSLSNNNSNQSPYLPMPMRKQNPGTGTTTESYLQMIRKTSHYRPSPKKPKPIPSHLKFGKFNMRHKYHHLRNEKSNHSNICSNNSHNITLSAQPRTQTQSQVQVPLIAESSASASAQLQKLGSGTDSSSPEPVPVPVPAAHAHNYENNNHEKSEQKSDLEGSSTSQAQAQEKLPADDAAEAESNSNSMISAENSNFLSLSLEDSNKSLLSLSNENDLKNINSTAEHVLEFSETNYTVGLVAEKILGIHSLQNHHGSQGREVNLNTTTNKKVSHTRAFRV